MRAGRDGDAGCAAGGATRKKGLWGLAQEALEAAGRVSPATNRRYPLTTVGEMWCDSRSSVYALQAILGAPLTSDLRQPGKRGPKRAPSDEELVDEIRRVLKASPFLGEDHGKARARLAAKGVRVGKSRVPRLIRSHGLLAPVRRGQPRGDQTHCGRIRTEKPNELSARTRRGSGRRRRAGADSSQPSITAPWMSSAGTLRTRAPASASRFQWRARPSRPATAAGPGGPPQRRPSRNTALCPANRLAKLGAIIAAGYPRRRISNAKLPERL